ncbi:MAG: cysteine desulfurase [Candidatus Melainabacteria bacterium]|jgi:cysteine desulfurase / selenocysteine lyase|nr:cysteine desulfurase [Candidatus Melainabacteria bacterium]
MTKTSNITQARKDFPILEQHCYLDSAATSQKPVQVIEAMKEFMLNSNGTVRRGVYELSVQSTQAFDNVRTKVQDFLNAKSSNEIIFTKGTTESINMLAYSFTEWLRLGQKEITKTSDIDSGNKSTAAEILISGLEHHANIVPWQIHTNRIGATLKSIPVLDNGELDLEACKTLIANGKVKLVAITALANSTGTIVPVKEITELAHQHGALVLVDGAQAVAHQKIDLQDLDVDFFAFSGHKLYGPTGIGVLYGKEKYLNAMPPYHGGGEMIDKVTLTETSFAQAPFKFEAGTPPIVEAVGLGAAIDYINNLGIENISQYEHELYSYALSKAKEIEGLKIIASTENKTGIISFVFDDIGSFDIGTMMNEHGVAIRTGHHCAQPVMERFGVDSTARISIAFYNNKEDIDKCFEALAKTVRIFR